MMYILIIKLSYTEMIQEKISEAMCLERAAILICNCEKRAVMINTKIKDLTKILSQYLIK